MKRSNKCKECGLEIVWVKRERWYGLNPDGSDHWDLCSKTRFEQIKAQGEAFKTKTHEGFNYKDKKGREKTKLTRITTGKFVTGKNYKPHNCKCIPWEDCSCGAEPNQPNAV